MSESNETPEQSEKAEADRKTWYVDEHGNIKGHWATFIVDRFVEFTDVAKRPPSTRSTQEVP